MARRTGKKDNIKIKTKHRNKTTRLIKLVVIAFIVIMFVLAIKNIFILRSENKKLEQRYQTLVTEKEQLTEELKNVNDKEYIEEQARIQLRMIKPGEIIYILQEEKTEKEKDKGNEKDN